MEIQKKVRCEDCDGCCCDHAGCCQERGKCPEHDIPEETMSIEDKAFWDAFSRGDEKRKRIKEDSL